MIVALSPSTLLGRYTVLYFICGFMMWSRFKWRTLIVIVLVVKTIGKLIPLALIKLRAELALFYF